MCTTCFIMDRFVYFWRLINLCASLWKLMHHHRGNGYLLFIFLGDLLRRWRLSGDNIKINLINGPDENHLKISKRCSLKIVTEFLNFPLIPRNSTVSQNHSWSSRKSTINLKSLLSNNFSNKSHQFQV